MEIQKESKCPVCYRTKALNITNFMRKPKYLRINDDFTAVCRKCSERKSKVKKTRPEIVCENKACDKIFTQKRNNQRFCSRFCRESEYWDNREKATRAQVQRGLTIDEKFTKRGKISYEGYISI